MIKCIITDIDQTLTNKDMKLTARTIEAVRNAKEHGIDIILCSGRPYNGMKTYIEELNLWDTFSVGFNGGVVFDNRTSSIIRSSAFLSRDIENLMKFLLASGVNFHLESPEKIFTGFYHVGKYTVRDCFITEMPLVVEDFEHLKKKDDICKIMISDYEQILDRLVIPPELKIQYKFVRSRPYYLEITPKNVNKGLAVSAVCEMLHHDASEIVGIGDGLNDYELLEAAGISVAVENADHRLKEIADYIVPDHDCDGFAVMIEKIINKEIF